MTPSLISNNTEDILLCLKIINPIIIIIPIINFNKLFVVTEPFIILNSLILISQPLSAQAIPSNTIGVQCVRDDIVNPNCLDKIENIRNIYQKPILL